MAIRHIVASITSLLEKNDRWLTDFFSIPGEEIRKDLIDKMARGEIYIGSENCDSFDPKKGCQCHLKDEQQIDALIIRPEVKRLNF